MKKRYTLRGYISAVCICTMIITVLSVGIVSYLFIRQSSIKQIEKEDSWLVQQQSDNVSYLISRINALTLDLAFDSDIQKMLVDYNYYSPTISGSLYKMSVNDIRIKVSSLFWDNYSYSDDFINIILFALDGEILGMKESYNTYADIEDYEWYPEVSRSTGANLWFAPCTDDNSLVTRSTVSIPVVRKVFSVQEKGNNYKRATIALPLGYMIAYINMDAFTKLMNEEALEGDRTFLLLDSDKTIIGGKDKRDVGMVFEPETGQNGIVTFNGDHYMMSSAPVRGSGGWQFVVMTSASEANREANQTLLLCLLICMVLTVILLIMTRILAQRINYPVNVLHSFFRKAEDENVAITEVTPFSEFNDLYQSFNHMVDEIYTMSEEIRKQELMQQELETESRESQIRALQMQINPHFLYNTLDSINWMAQMNGDKEVSDMILTLGRFFRSNIEMKGNYTSVEQELKNIELYMTLAKLRYGARLHYDIEVDSALYGCEIIRLLLQPLVENSIKYGVEKKAGDETIHVWIGEEDGMLAVSVSDDGIGIAAEALDELRHLWENIGDYHETARRIGLYNIMRRLYLCYKEECTFEVFSEENAGTNVVITYPRRLCSRILD